MSSNVIQAATDSATPSEASHAATAEVFPAPAAALISVTRPAVPRLSRSSSRRRRTRPGVSVVRGGRRRSSVRTVSGSTGSDTGSPIATVDSTRRSW